VVFHAIETRRAIEREVQKDSLKATALFNVFPRSLCVLARTS
jgi:hypothetical protein